MRQPEGVRCALRQLCTEAVLAGTGMGVTNTTGKSWSPLSPTWTSEQTRHDEVGVSGSLNTTHPNMWRKPSVVWVPAFSLTWDPPREELRGSPQPGIPRRGGRKGGGLPERKRDKKQMRGKGVPPQYASQNRETSDIKSQGNPTHTQPKLQMNAF